MRGSTEDESFRGTMQARTPDNAITTVIVTRQGLGAQARTWLTLSGSTRCTVVTNDRQLGELVSLLLASGAGGAR